MVDYCEDNIETHPHCLHGPTLLFLRKRNGRKFFACSAFRNRKNCRFFQWMDEASHLKKISETQSFETLLETFKTRRSGFKRLLRSSIEKYFCHTCNMFISVEDEHRHLKHELEKKVNSTALSYPTAILKPIKRTKGESQFHFSDNTIKTLSNFLLDLVITGVLCVGCPRLHEHILNSSQRKEITSLLLDIDYRYFYDPDKFQMFNMFNCHFFDKNGWSFIETVAHEEKVAIIADPPFGGRIEPLAYSLNRLITAIERERKSSSWKNVLVLLILPYFMESSVKKLFPSFQMLDYKVEYRNHRKFKNKSTIYIHLRICDLIYEKGTYVRKQIFERTSAKGHRGSAVRIFTNFSLSSFKLPAEEGYKYCAECDRWVCKENKHCIKCNACTSKNGRTYKHCDKCGKCVKITWRHCSTCNVCKLEQHNCSSVHNVMENEYDINDEKEIFVKKKRKLTECKIWVK